MEPRLVGRGGGGGEMCVPDQAPLIIMVRGSKPGEQYGFSNFFLFLLFSNSDILKNCKIRT